MWVLGFINELDLVFVFKGCFIEEVGRRLDE